MPNNHKPSDFPIFCMAVHSASATLLDLDQYMAVYGEILHLMFWNPDIDTPMAIAEAEAQAKASQSKTHLIGQLNG
ncbi:MAG: hypothetical protein QX203_14550 [Methylococcaceae bacterium]